MQLLESSWRMAYHVMQHIRAAYACFGLLMKKVNKSIAFSKCSKKLINLPHIIICFFFLIKDINDRSGLSISSNCIN